MRCPPSKPVSPTELGCSPLTAPPLPSPPAYICSNQIMGWGEKAIEIRSVETGHLDGVFMHKRAQRLKFLCERNDKVGMTRGPGSCTGWAPRTWVPGQSWGRGGSGSSWKEASRERTVWSQLALPSSSLSENSPDSFIREVGLLPTSPSVSAFRRGWGAL